MRGYLRFITDKFNAQIGEIGVNKLSTFKIVFLDVGNQWVVILVVFFFFQAEDGIRDVAVTGVQTCALPIFVVEGSSRPIDASRVTVKDARTGANGQVRLDVTHPCVLECAVDPGLFPEKGRRSEERRVGKECRCRW